MFHATIITHPDEKARDKHLATLLSKLKIHMADQLHLSEPTVVIADIRRATAFLSRSPFASEYKVVIISGELNQFAQQSLLKTLEEPPNHSLIIISVANTQSLLPTVLSRSRIEQLDIGTSSTSNDSHSASTAWWNRIFSATLGQRLKEVGELPTDRGEALEWTRNEMVNVYDWLHKDLKNSDKLLELTTIQYAQTLSSLQQTHNYLKQNISVKLALDHLMIALPVHTLPPLPKRG